MPVLRMPECRHFDGTYLDSVRMEGDTFVRHRVQPARNATMRAIAEVQKAGHLNGHAETALGRWALSIPKSDFWNLVARNPDLNSPDKTTLDRAWRKFTASAESIPYRMTE
jgi:hypothetical protein